MNKDKKTNRKLSQDINAGDTFREYSRDSSPWLTVKRVLSPAAAGSWQECRGSGFPRIETTKGEVRMLVYGELYDVL